MTRSEQVRMRVTGEEKAALQEQRAKRGYGDDSSYLRGLVRDDGKRLERKKGRDA